MLCGRTLLAPDWVDAFVHILPIKWTVWGSGASHASSPDSERMQLEAGSTPCGTGMVCFVDLAFFPTVIGKNRTCYING